MGADRTSVWTCGAAAWVAEVAPLRGDAAGLPPSGERPRSLSDVKSEIPRFEPGFPKQGAYVVTTWVISFRVCDPKPLLCSENRASVNIKYFIFTLALFSLHSKGSGAKTRKRNHLSGYHTSPLFWKPRFESGNLTFYVTQGSGRLSTEGERGGLGKPAAVTAASGATSATQAAASQVQTEVLSAPMDAQPAPHRICLDNQYQP
eukprot:TRINITY_DN81_c0_g1_i1.p1 TRINITY_DN81_c0_g1~~TRINITY_DN81_c0_g1_i1.p1  ORF type:complete len:204 (+),score=1.76 TRINITY_DN81_c0_g1_i1:98-709(+)